MVSFAHRQNGMHVNIMTYLIYAFANVGCISANTTDGGGYVGPNQSCGKTNRIECRCVTKRHQWVNGCVIQRM